MNHRTTTARSPTPFLMAAKEGKTPSAGIPFYVRYLCNFGMGWATENEKASLATVVFLNSCVLDLTKNAFWYVPEVSTLFDMAAESFASCMELLALSGLRTVATSFGGSQTQPTAEVLAQSMDVAIGERFTAPCSTVTSISGGQAKPQRKVKSAILEHSMDIAIGAEAA